MRQEDLRAKVGAGTGLPARGLSDGEVQVRHGVEEDEQGEGEYERVE